MLYALLFVPALAAIAYAALRWRRPPLVVAAAAPEPEPVAEISGDVDPLQALESLLAELERATLDERDVAELERLADQLEATARELERV